MPLTGMDVGMDIVPYTMGNTTATILFPPCICSWRKIKAAGYIRNPETRQRMEKKCYPQFPNGHWEEGSWSDPYIQRYRMETYPGIAFSLQTAATSGQRENPLSRSPEMGTTEFSTLCRLMMMERRRVALPSVILRPWIEKCSMNSHPLMSIGRLTLCFRNGYAAPVRIWMFSMSTGALQ